jgi:hypothetical protein
LHIPSIIAGIIATSLSLAVSVEVINILIPSLETSRVEVASLCICTYQGASGQYAASTLKLM